MGVMVGLVTYVYRVNMSIAIVCMVKTEPDITGVGNVSIASNITYNDTYFIPDALGEQGQGEIAFNSTMVLQVRN